MRRIRIVFIALSAVLLVSMGLLIQRALASLALEREVRHRAVAERLFDEMESALSRILAVEEERPFGAYRFYELGPDGEPTHRRSPLSNPPEAPFVVGYFQIDPDASFHSPLWPRDEALARARGDWKGPGEAGSRVGSLEDLVRGGFANLAAGVVAPQAALAPAPGTTRELRKRDRGDAKSSADRTAPLEGKGKVSTYAALRSLNRAAESRVARQKLRKEAALDQMVARAAPRRGERFESEADAQEVMRFEDLDESPGAVVGLFLGRLASAPAAAPAPVRAQPTLRPPVLEPLIGRVLDDRHLLLYRTALVGARGYRQGLVIEVPALTRSVEAAVFAGSELAPYARSAFFVGAAGAGRPGNGAFAYEHRFAEPFDGVAVQTILDPLPGGASEGLLKSMAIVLLLAGSAGLFAVYRMVAVTVGFAERRSNFVAAVTHELKTPLTSIRMYAEMLRDGMVESEAKRDEYYSTITAESERLSRLIDNVLEFSRLEQGTRELNLVVGSVAPVLEEAARLLEPHAREIGFRLRVEIEPSLPPVRFDRDAVTQVVFNLVDNALKYARDAGDREVVLHAGATGDGVVISVRDRGPGVPPRHLSKIFDPFYRGENELTRRSRGTGIGLALVKGLSEQMGGVVDGGNAPDGGFEVSLRLRAAASA